MKYTVIFLISFLVAVLSCDDKPANSNPIDQEYQNSLNLTKKFYPFNDWRKAYAAGMTQYNESNCNKMQKIFDDLIFELAKLGKTASEPDKISLFKEAILKTNALNSVNDDALIETGEAEQLVELTNKIAIAIGIDHRKYGQGEGPATEWREW